jgi:hypothetical protein
LDPGPALSDVGEVVVGVPRHGDAVKETVSLLTKIDEVNPLRLVARHNIDREGVEELAFIELVTA